MRIEADSRNLVALMVPVLMSLGHGGSATAGKAAKPESKEPGSMTAVEEKTCGQEIAADAEVPAKLARLMGHVAANMQVHARWAAADPRGQAEHDSLMVVAREYQAIAAAAERAAAAMRSMKDLPAAPHDPTKLDRAAQARWMRAKIAMQLDFAELLVAHAEVSKKVLAELERAPAAGAGRPLPGAAPTPSAPKR